MAQPEHSATQELADVLDDNVRRNVRLLMALKDVDRPRIYRALGMSRQSFGARMNGHTRFTAAEVRILAYLLNESADTLYTDPDEVFRPVSPAADDESGESLAARMERELGWARSRCSSLPPMSEALADGIDVIGSHPKELPGQRRMALAGC